MLFYCGATNVNDALSGNPCLLILDSGPCRAMVEKYYFDADVETCLSFMWGGCKGTVPFDTLAECEEECMEVSNTKYLENLATSRSSWENTKDNNSNKYQHITTFTSWTGYKNEIIINVQNNIIVSRRFLALNQKNEILSDWVEDTSAKLGTNKEGSPLKTVDDLYEECREILLTKKQQENHIYFTFHTNGVVKHCMYSPENCADDCNRGVRIDTIKF